MSVVQAGFPSHRWGVRCTGGVSVVQRTPHFYNGHPTCTTDTPPLRRGHSEFPSSRTRHSMWAWLFHTCTTETPPVQWIPHLYDGHPTCTMDTPSVQLTPHFYNGHPTCTTDTPLSQRTPHLYNGHPTFTTRSFGVLVFMHQTQYVGLTLPHLYNGNPACTTDTQYVQRTPHFYNGHPTFTTDTPSLQRTPHLYDEAIRSSRLPAPDTVCGLDSSTNVQRKPHLYKRHPAFTTTPCGILILTYQTQHVRQRH